MNSKSKNQNSAEHVLLSEIRVKTPKGTRLLKKEEQKQLIQMFAVKASADRFDIHSLAPRGSFLDRILRHFEDTDISYALPIMQVIMTAASMLTQKGAYLDVPGVGRTLPTLWTVGLAGSGSSKTLAAEEIDRIVSHGATEPVSRLATGCTDAQWIVELHDNNGAFWFQDEVGKCFKAILTQGNYLRIKFWCLDAYSHKTIANRLKSETSKLVIEQPFFTFHGLSVDDTWRSEVDLTSMLDGFCQRFSYYLAVPRNDTDMFDHFIYFEGKRVEQRRQDLAKIWDALCSQDGVGGPFKLNDEVLPYLKEWWRDLRKSWGQSALPKSFIRRIGFAVLRYLMVLQFLLGKSGRLIDVETAELATRFAEYHFLSALHVVQQYDAKNTSRIQLLTDASSRVAENGNPVTNREVTRSLSKKQRAQFDKGEIAEILSILNEIDHDIDPKILELVMDKVTNRHPGLRSLPAADGSGLVMCHYMSPLLSWHDLSALPDEERAAEVRRLAQANIDAGFDFESGPLLRALLLKIEEKKHILCVAVSHLVCDGWSLEIVMEDIAGYYTGVAQSRFVKRRHVPQLGEILAAERDRKEAGDLLDARDYWLNIYSDTLPPDLNLPIDHPRPPVRSYKGERHAFSLDPVLPNRYAVLRVPRAVLHSFFC